MSDALIRSTVRYSKIASYKEVLCFIRFIFTLCLGRNYSYSPTFKIQIHLFSEQVPRNHSDRHLHIPIASLLRIITSPNRRQLHYKSQFLPETLTTKISPSVDSSCIHCSSYCTPHRLILICITLHNKITLHCNHGED